MTIEGTLPEFDLRRAFVDGAKWWEFHETGASMWQSDRNLAETIAQEKYGEHVEVLRARLTATEAALEAARQYVKMLREYISPREMLKGIDEERDGRNYRAALSRLAETRGA